MRLRRVGPLYVGRLLARHGHLFRAKFVRKLWSFGYPLSGRQAMRTIPTLLAPTLHMAQTPYVMSPLRIAFLIAVTVFVIGCSQEPASPVPSEEVELIKPTPTPSTNLPSQGEPAELIEPETKPVPEAKQAIYTPPFPDRANLFEPLRQANRRARSKSDDNTESVVLMGFANLGTPKVVLAIDGIVAPLADGDELAGVKVISIAPPMAVLQRGRSRWTAMLE